MCCRWVFMHLIEWMERIGSNEKSENICLPSGKIHDGNRCTCSSKAERERNILRQAWRENRLSSLNLMILDVLMVGWRHFVAFRDVFCLVYMMMMIPQGILHQSNTHPNPIYMYISMYPLFVFVYVYTYSTLHTIFVAPFSQTDNLRHWCKYTHTTTHGFVGLHRGLSGMMLVFLLPFFVGCEWVWCAWRNIKWLGGGFCVYCTMDLFPFRMSCPNSMSSSFNMGELMLIFSVCLFLWWLTDTWHCFDSDGDFLVRSLVYCVRCNEYRYGTLNYGIIFVCE